MRGPGLAWSVALLLFLGCGSGDADTTDTPATRPEAGEAVDGAARETSTPPAGRSAVRGTVRDAVTDRPLANVQVSAGDLGASTDGSGTFVLPFLPAGENVLSVYRRGFLAESVSVELDPATSASVEVALEPAAPACCRFGGTWTARFDLDSAGLNGRPPSRSVEGRVRFPPSRPEVGEGPVRIAESRGSAELDFAPLLGAEIEGGVDDVRGAIFHGDSAALTMLPRFGDWAIELRGSAAGDTVRGDWYQRASCCGAYGTFLLIRESSASPPAER